jgi:hypothetical protein
MKTADASTNIIVSEIETPTPKPIDLPEVPESLEFRSPRAAACPTIVIGTGSWQEAKNRDQVPSSREGS